MLFPFARSPLFNEAGDGDAGGGGAGAGAGGAPVGGVAGANQNAGGAGDDAPVSRAEFQALMAKLDKLGQPPPPPISQPPADVPEWGRQLHASVTQLVSSQQAQAMAAAKQSFAAAVLADVPEANRAMASLMLDGLIASQGIDPTKATPELAQAINTQFRQQFGAALFQVAGSPYRAVPRTATGAYDWDNVHDFNGVPPELIRHMPDSAVRRIVNGGGNSANNDSIPRNIFTHPRQ